MDSRLNGIILAHADRQRILTPASGKNAAAQRAISGERGTMETRSSSGELDLVAFAPVPRVPWAVLILDPTEAAFAPLNALTQRALLLIGVTMLIAAGLGVVLARTITRPVRQLVTGAEEIGRGNLEHRIPASNRAELGQLADAFNTMAENLRRSQGEIARLYQETRAWADELEERVKMRTQEVRQSEERFRIAVESASDVIWEWTIANGNLQWFGAIDVILGYAPGEFSRTLAAWEGLIHSNDHDRVMSALDQHLKTGAPYSEEYRVCRKDGSAGYWIDRGMALRDEHGQPYKMIGVCTDITKRKRAEEDRERLMSELAQKNQELEQIIFVTSHDLRSPLVNAQGFSKELRYSLEELQTLFQRDSVPADIRAEASAIMEGDIREALTFILASIVKMDTLLSGLLRLSRLGRAALTMTRLDMNALVAQVVKTCTFQIVEAGATLDIAALPPCRGDATQINQVFSNLLGNALKYLDSARSGHIKIWGRQKSGHTVYCVKDNGIGIPAEHQKKVFDLFHRLNPAQSPGDGLGLTIVQKILERHNGRIWVESETGTGSAFYISLPGGMEE